VKSRPSRRPSRSRRSRTKQRNMWDRDHLPPRITSDVPAHIQKALLDAHKKAGTYFQRVAR
jgi:hypothetical protein